MFVKTILWISCNFLFRFYCWLSFKTIIFNLKLKNYFIMAMILIIYLAIVVLMIASIWTVYSKAGKPGWAAIVPIYNIIVLLEIVQKPIWWIVLLMIPFVNFIILIIIYLELAKVFGKSSGFGLGLIFLGIIFLPMLAFGDAQYVGAKGTSDMLDN